MTIVLSCAPAATAATARTTVSNGGGYLGKADPLRSARMAMRVPTLKCVKGGPSATVTIGLFGSTHTGSGTDQWLVGVIASCTHGVSKYRATLGDPAGPYALRVHHGDLVQLSAQRGPQWKITDVTTGEGVGAAGAVGPGDHPRTDRHVLIGAHLKGHLSRTLTVTVRAAKINRQPLDQAPHHRRVQSRAMTIVVRPGAMSPSGTRFPISIG